MTPAVSALAALVGFGAALGATPSGPTLEPTRQVTGVLEEVDFIHQTGRFRIGPADDRVEFTLRPDAAVEYLNAGADLRDLPLGTAFEFTLHRDPDGRFTRAVRIRDRFTADARAGTTYRVDEVNPAAGTFRATPLVRGGSGPKERPAAGTTEFRTTARTRIWQGDKTVSLATVAVGDEILADMTGATAAVCADVWIGRATHAAVTARQRQRYAAFVKARGLPARVERTDGRTLTLAVFGGEPASSEQTWPGDSSRPGRSVRVCVANEELRTWNPPVDHEWGKIVEFHKAAPDCRDGVRLVVTVNHMLEGFRRGRYVRVFPDAWRPQDQPFGEQLFHYGARAFPPELAECPAKEYPGQYPFRTDYGNTHLPWYQLTPGAAPPPDSEHRVFGELLAVDADRRSGRFRSEETQTEVEFALIPGGTVRSRNADTDLADIPVGTRCRFHLYQDEAGTFRRANFVTDEVSDLVKNGALWRVESLDLAAGMLTAARQPPGVRNDQGDPEQPPDIGRTTLRVGADTRVWKGDKQVALSALAVGDLLLVNRTGDRPGRPSRCTDVWVGTETHKQFTTPRPRKPTPPLPAPKGTPR
ncbi:MAG: hypothetical protein JWO38_3351 [Gemmataceae bacterium]|nr:hypothetical protein [Gemmataceae bacterium]